MKLIALVQDAESIARYLRHLGLPTEVPPVAPLSGARACPPCPCPTRLRRARRPREGHRSGRAASSAVATASHPTRPRRRGSLQPLLRSSPATRPACQRGHASVCPETRNSLARAWVRVGIQQSLPPGLGVQATDHKIATAPNTPRGPLFRLRPHHRSQGGPCRRRLPGLGSHRRFGRAGAFRTRQQPCRHPRSRSSRDKPALRKPSALPRMNIQSRSHLRTSCPDDREFRSVADHNGPP